MQKRKFSFNFKRNTAFKAFLDSIFVKALLEDTVMDQMTKKKIPTGTRVPGGCFYFFNSTLESYYLDLKFIKLDFGLEITH